MKPHYLSITRGGTESFSARLDIKPDVNNHWHYHDELELIYIKKGSGTRFIGDSISTFTDGDMALIGSNLPHYWQFDDSFFDGDAAGVEVYVVHFKKDFLGRDFFGLPENSELSRLIELSERGVSLESPNKKIADSVVEVVKASGTKRILFLLEALLEIAQCKNKQQLVSIGFKADFAVTEKDRLQSIYNFTIKHYRRKIELKEAAALIQLTESAFCKFFKSRTGKTYTEFVNEIRVGHACRLLIENRMNVKEICFLCGFQNTASFHKCFKDVMDTTPLKYQKQYV
ncbi:AraC family transcriptional regulator [Flavobacterium sp. RHBU_3]|uniref:AraC family transcriptional regulator n=1 Tax=Flavobacterium sp. RHBU_3 TaxID=3391184 RepID=UPI003985598A